MRGYLFNSVTQKMDYRDMPTHDDEAVQYIPQDVAAQNIYRIRREMGDDILHALLYVLERCLPSGSTPAA